MTLIQSSMRQGCRLPEACEEVEISLRTYRRWTIKGENQGDKRPIASRPTPSNKLSEAERKAILAVCNEETYASLPPSQIVPRLLDQGIYLGSESSFYRILKAEGQLHHRGRSRVPKKHPLPTTHHANGPNEVWTWDITYCPGRVRGMFYFLYMIVDIFSRKIVGYEVYEQERGEHAAELIQRSLLREKCFRKPLVLHSDNGAPMKASTMKAKLEELGIIPSYSRPRVSNDNPFSESLFRTLKYRPEWPSSGFESLKEAQNWVQRFVGWYNNEHRHSRLNFVTPVQRHEGLDTEILVKRKCVLEKVKDKHPNRWSKEVRNTAPVGSVTLNPERSESEAVDKAA